jgi:endonuclease/exonuclease/phosphatase family metal-dependent hydrolase
MKRPRLHLPRVPRIIRRKEYDKDVLFHNIACGNKAAKFRHNVGLHVRGIFGKDSEYIKSKGSLDQSLRLVDAFDQPEVTSFAEVYGDQREQLGKAMTARGYESIHWGVGATIGEEQLQVMLATRKLSLPIEIPGAADLDRQVGGMVAAHMPDEDCALLACHVSKWWNAEELEVIEAFVKQMQDHNRFIACGDFNRRQKHLPDGIKSQDWYSPKRIPTCSLTPVLRWFHKRRIDHLLGGGFEPTRKKVIRKGIHSDHAALYSRLKYA